MGVLAVVAMLICIFINLDKSKINLGGQWGALPPKIVLSRLMTFIFLPSESGTPLKISVAFLMSSRNLPSRTIYFSQVNRCM